MRTAPTMGEGLRPTRIPNARSARVRGCHATPRLLSVRCLMQLQTFTVATGGGGCGELVRRRRLLPGAVVALAPLAPPHHLDALPRRVACQADLGRHSWREAAVFLRPHASMWCSFQTPSWKPTQSLQSSNACKRFCKRQTTAKASGPTQGARDRRLAAVLKAAEAWPRRPSATARSLCCGRSRCHGAEERVVFGLA